MAKKKEEIKKFDIKKIDQHMKEQNVCDMLEVNYMPYAMSVIISRALPDVRDGLKPSQRKVLYTMKTMGLKPGNKSKSANIAGRTLLLNPHSDASCYETMVRMVDKNETLLTPFVEGKGSFGKHYSRDMAPASARYSEASLSKIGTFLFDGIEQNAIDMVDNYDGTMKEPSVLPVAFPNILANPQLGIAVGFASNICSFNLKELCEATIQRIKHPKDDLLEIMPTADFSTGGYILFEKEEILNIYKTGKGSIRIRAKYEIDKKNQKIEITEIPFSTTSEAIVEKVVELCKKGTISEINDIRDDTDKNGLMITIDYKRSCNPEKLIDKLFKLTTLEDTFSCNFNVIVDNNPICLGVYSLIDEWVKFRKNCVKRMLIFEKENLSKKLHLLKGLEKILIDIDKAIKIIKNTVKDIDVVPNLMKGFKVDEIQAEYIANIRLRNINKEYILERTSEISNIEKRLSVLEKQINSENEIKKIIINELLEISKKYAPERKSKILYNFKEIVYDEKKEEIKKSIEDLILLIDQSGCIKKISKIQPEEIEKYKKENNIIYQQNINNLEDLLVFTNKGNVYKTKVSLIKKDNISSVGTFVNALCEFEEDEIFLFAFATKDYTKNILIVFEDGKAVTYPVKSYETKTNRKMLMNGFSTHAKALLFDIIEDDREKDLNKYLIKSTNNKGFVFKAKDVTFKTTRNSMGATILRLGKGQTVKSCTKANNLSDKMLRDLTMDSYPSSGKNIK